MASRKEGTLGLFQRFAGAIDLTQTLVGTEDVNSIGQCVDGRLPHAVGGHQCVAEFDVCFGGIHLQRGGVTNETLTSRSCDPGPHSCPCSRGAMPMPSLARKNVVISHLSSITSDHFASRFVTESGR